MSFPQPLQHLVDRFNETVVQYNSGGISEADAMAVLNATSVTDASGAVWSVAPQGYFQRAARPGDPPQQADASEYVDPSVPRPPQPAFPAPALFGQPQPAPAPGYPPTGMSPLDTPPQIPPQFYGDPRTGQSPGAPGVPTAAGASFPDETGKRFRRRKKGPDSSAPRPLAETQPARARPAILESLTGFFAANKTFTVILIVGAVIIGAAFAMQQLGDSGASEIPSIEEPADMPIDPPAVTATVPSSTDAAAVITALQTGTSEQIQSIINVDLAPVDLLRTQALWAGLGQTKTLVTPDVAAEGPDGTATQTWQVTADGATEPAATITVTWVVVDGVWKLNAAPSF